MSPLTSLTQRDQVHARVSNLFILFLGILLQITYILLLFFILFSQSGAHAHIHALLMIIDTILIYSAVCPPPALLF
jgi:hypothetical protein